ncbi:hypothetical protein TSMEX_005730 [Taenia solium]|eukprot:TsM_000269200 transcript=TsM_000269200 gene=TsM_000269200
MTGTNAPFRLYLDAGELIPVDLVPTVSGSVHDQS